MRQGIGVDGCRSGWFGALLREGREWSGGIFDTLQALVDSWDDGSSLVLVDVPIGLPDNDSFRACDAEARAYLGSPRASSVFNPPTRSALGGRNWEEAANLNQAACGKRLSKQTWALFPKIREVDQFLRRGPARQERVREVHPEVLFRALNFGDPVAAKKKSAQGRQDRLALIEQHVPGSTTFFDQTARGYRRAALQLDDILDAMAAALVAQQFSDALVTFPEAPELDSKGLRCEMVFPVLGRTSHNRGPVVELRSDSGMVYFRGQGSPDAVKKAARVLSHGSVDARGSAL